MNESTIFFANDKWYKNVKSSVDVGEGEGSFRNAPQFLSLVNPTKMDAEYETEAVLDHYFHHQNVAPFVADFFIKRFVTSNPSPRYAEVVATAFKEGEYDGIGSGDYGDLSATIAAVLLDRESLSATDRKTSKMNKTRSDEIL